MTNGIRNQRRRILRLGRRRDAGHVAILTHTDQHDDQIVSEVCENQEGAVDGIVIYDGNMTVQFTIVAKAAATLPVKGGTLAVGALSFIIEKVGRAKKHKGKLIVTLNAIKHDNLVLGA